MATDDFFRSRLDQMIDLLHPLVVLATRLPWAAIEAAVAPKLAHLAKARLSALQVRTWPARFLASWAAASARRAARGCRCA